MTYVSNIIQVGLLEYNKTRWFCLKYSTVPWYCTCFMKWMLTSWFISSLQCWEVHFPAEMENVYCSVKKKNLKISLAFSTICNQIEEYFVNTIGTLQKNIWVNSSAMPVNVICFWHLWQSKSNMISQRRDSFPIEYSFAVCW